MKRSEDARALRPIGEIATELGVAAHVLRFWESRFPAIAPLKMQGGRRFYRAADVALLRAVSMLSRTHGMTLAGVEKLLSERGPAWVAAEYGDGPGLAAPAAVPDPDRHVPLRAARDRLAAALESWRAA